MPRSSGDTPSRSRARSTDERRSAGVDADADGGRRGKARSLCNLGVVVLILAVSVVVFHPLKRAILEAFDIASGSQPPLKRTDSPLGDSTTTSMASSTTSPRIGLILGSTRESSNTEGISTYILSVLAQLHPSVDIQLVHLSKTSTAGHPLPLQLESVIPAAHDLSTLPDAYADSHVRAWSSTVLQWDGCIILTPQYNWGIPAPLKNAFDHLYKEWHGLPLGLVTIGGHGGTKVVEQLRTVCAGGLHMNVLDQGVQITLPRALITGNERVKGDEDWLKAYEGDIKAMADTLIPLVEEKRRARVAPGV